MMENAIMQFVVRSETAYKVANGNFKFGKDNVPEYFDERECSFQVVYSENGRLHAQICTNVVNIMDETGHELVCEVERSGVQAAHFSPDGKFLVTWEKMMKSNKPMTEVENGNLIIWDISQPKGRITARFFQREFNLGEWPSIQWSPGGRFYLRVVKNNIEVFDGTSPSQKPTFKVHVPNVVSFAVAPSEVCRIAAFVPDKKGAPAQVKVYSFPNFEQCTATKSFFKAEEVELKWNARATALLIQTRTDVDTSGKTYYGETGLHLLLADGSFSCTVPSTVSGPVQGCGWHPQGRNFVVIQGKQPATSTLFNVDQCTPLFSFGSGPHNTVRFSPHGRFLCLCGFGNLAGNMDFWDFNKKKKIGSCQDRDGAKSFEWTPDGRAFVTAVLRPWRRVDNGYRVWSYAGELLHEERQEFLYQVTFRPPQTPDTFPDRPMSPRLRDKRNFAAHLEAEEATKPKKYVPPSLRARMAANNGKTTTKVLGASGASGPKKFSKAEQRAFMVSNVEVSEPQTEEEAAARRSSTTSAAAKRRQRKKRQAEKLKAEEEARKVEEELQKAREEAEREQRLANMSSDEKRAKRIKAIRKKLRQIDAIAKRRDEGESLDDAALKKLSTADALQSELAELTGEQ